MIDLYQRVREQLSSETKSELDTFLVYEILRLYSREKRGSKETISYRGDGYSYEIMERSLDEFVRFNTRKSQYFMSFRFSEPIATKLINEHPKHIILSKRQLSNQNYTDIQIDLSTGLDSNLLITLIDQSYEIQYQKLDHQDKRLLSLMDRESITLEKISEALQLTQISKIDEVIQLIQPALRIKTFPIDSWYLDESSSRFGGNPNMPSNFEWPHFEGKPLSFLAQINLSEVPDFPNRALLPQKGILYFFSALGWQEEFPWDKYNDRNHARVLFYDGDLEKLEHRMTPPNMPQTWTNYESAELQFLPELTLPDADEWSIDPTVTKLNLNEKDLEALSKATWQLRHLYNDFYRYIPRHQLLGYPSAIQHTIATSDSRLLLQIDTDYENVGFQWGDGGKIYFLISHQALKELAFEEAYAIYESH